MSHEIHAGSMYSSLGYRASGVRFFWLICIMMIGLPTVAQTIPTDAQPTCSVTPALMASWFETGAVSLNGVVKAADSVTFPDVPNCSFYQWSWQMFLWLTSPVPARYGGGKHIFDSAIFYDVSPPAAGVRQFIPHVPGTLRNFAVRSAQRGPNGLPVIMDKRGRMFEVEPTRFAPNGRQVILNGTGATVEIERAAIGPNRKLVLMDRANKAIIGAKPIFRPQLNTNRMAQKIMIDKLPIFLDLNGNIIDTEAGQADGAALMAQNGSLVYYTLSANEVYAYLLTGDKTGGILPKPTQFPTTPAELNKIVAFAATKGKVFVDPNALAIELKTAWVEAAGLANLNTYITMQATIPTYNKSDPNHWIPNGQKTATLAMVGMHVVGSTKGHPEMVWATFEHFGNTPNAAYSYNSTTGPKTVAQDTSGTWLFCANGSAGPFNDAHITASNNDLFSVSPFNISASNTLRWKPWGAASDASPNPLDATAAASNTEIISIDTSVLGKLLAGDIRKNYFMTGSTWTILGGAPTSSFGNPGNNVFLAGTQVGTSQLANTTMETYQQSNALFDMNSNNCFSCHRTNQFPVSHVYGDLKPLP